MPSRFVYFDLGNVLVHFDHEIAVAQLSRLSGSPPDDVRRVLFTSDLQNRYETGLVDDVQFAGQLNHELNTELSTSAILEAVSAIFQPNDEMLRVLQLVRDHSIDMGVLSNTCKAHWDYICSREWALPGDWFLHHVLSYEVRGMKPDARIYERSELLAECAPSDIFFTDDREENVAAAATRGWTTCQFQSAAQLEPQLARWLAG